MTQSAKPKRWAIVPPPSAASTSGETFHPQQNQALPSPAMPEEPRSERPTDLPSGVRNLEPTSSERPTDLPSGVMGHELGQLPPLEEPSFEAQAPSSRNSDTIPAPHSREDDD